MLKWAPPTSLFCWVCCHLHLLFRASLSAPLFIMVYSDFLSIRSLSWKPHIPDQHRHTMLLSELTAFRKVGVTLHTVNQEITFLQLTNNSDMALVL